MTAQAVELPAGSAPTADYADGVLTIGIPLGGDVSEAQIAQAVAEYLAKNPIAETDPTVPDWAKQPEKPSYTADEVGALSSETLPEAITTALAQAKESGEFDGAAGQDGAPGQDGITPTIGANGNWYLGDTDTGKPSRGETGQAGADGIDGADGQPGADGKSAYQYAVEGGYTGTEEAFAAKLAEEMPDTLPNPNALTFTGAVSGSYDGSAPVSVEIPSGGGGLTVTNTAAVGQTVKITAVDENGQPTEWEAVDMAIGGGGTTSDEWIDLGTLTLADGEEATNFSWKVNGQVKKIHIEGTYYSATSGKKLALFNSDGLSGPNPLITYNAFGFPSSAEKAMYMDLTVKELYPGYWFGVGGASIYNNPHENTITSYGSPKRVDSYLSLGAYWRDAPLTAGTWFNVKVVYY